MWSGPTLWADEKHSGKCRKPLSWGRNRQVEVMWVPQKKLIIRLHFRNNSWNGMKITEGSYASTCSTYWVFSSCPDDLERGINLKPCIWFSSSSVCVGWITRIVNVYHHFHPPTSPPTYCQFPKWFVAFVRSLSDIFSTLGPTVLKNLQTCQLISSQMLDWETDLLWREEDEDRPNLVNEFLAAYFHHLLITCKTVRTL